MYFVRNRLAIGRFLETTQQHLLQAYQINSMLQLAAPITQPGITTLYLPIEDGVAIDSNHLRQGIAFLREQRDAITLVACAAGISRSTTFVIAALMDQEGLDLFEAYRQIHAVHPMAYPHAELCKSLGAYYGLTLTDQEIAHGLWRATRP